MIINKSFIHDSSIFDSDADIGTGNSIWHFCHIFGTAKIGNNNNVGQGCYIAGEIGNNCRIQNNVSVYKGVILEDNIFIAPSVVFTNIKEPNGYTENKNYETTIVKSGAVIGANATIISGITIGENAFIGAGSVVTKDVIPHSLVKGNPAR